jgi:hypothetical protein
MRLNESHLAAAEDFSLVDELSLPMYRVSDPKKKYKINCTPFVYPNGN